ncbi:hypothetical protein DNTS_017278 [Danionella cerebrum]|uniref:G-protein coupled receptors family 1 profile domain-containing protein n=1 Tax=Danionella cerebrum TaxID=2873325 RepID=A0A553RPP2_9TELE|nr:hypothetical protein DNTS_017278 [Danionella translucida]
MSLNSTNSCITDRLEPANRLLASAVIYGLVLAIGLPLNTGSLWILIRRHGLRSPCAVLMVNLALSDLLLALSLPLRVYFYATLEWPFGVCTCTVAIMLFRINIRTSSIFITLISVDRMVALVFPLRSRTLRTSASALKGSILVWILISSLSIPEILRIHNGLKSCPYIPCFEFQVQGKGSGSISLSQAIFLLILMVVNIVSTVVVIVVLQKRPKVGATIVKNKINVMLIFVCIPIHGRADSVRTQIFNRAKCSSKEHKQPITRRCKHAGIVQLNAQRPIEMISSEIGGAKTDGLRSLTNHSFHHESVLKVTDSVTVLRITLGDT